MAKGHTMKRTSPNTMFDEVGQTEHPRKRLGDTPVEVVLR